VRVRFVASLLGLAASKVAVSSVPPGSQIELLPVAGASFFSSAVVASADGANVYSGGTYDVRGLSRDGLSGELTEVDLEPVWNGAIAISPDGAHLYVAGFDTQTSQVDQLAILARNAETGLLDPAGSVTSETGGTEDLSGIVSLTVSPDGAFLYVITTNSHGILVFARDAQTGALGVPPLVIDMTVAPTKIVISSDGAHAYVLSASEEELRIYSRSSETGDLTLLDTLSQLVFTVEDAPSYHLDVAISPDGGSVEVTSAPEDTITVFTRDAGSGALTFADEHVLHSFGVVLLDSLRLVAGDSITWVGRFRGAGPQPTSVARLDLIALSRSEESGLLTRIDDVTIQADLLGGTDLALSPDERHVYFGGYPDGVGGATLVPEPAAGALAAAAASALALHARRHRSVRRAR
jgi:DNA-binding beta-propeller fold protein YncE